ncbi:MAG: HNH endonuclease [Methylosarcina sp.]
MPSESLLNPPIFLGVLRVFARHEDERPSDPAVISELALVTKETNSPVDLARTDDRNLIRNSGQYWKGTGLLLPTRGRLQLTELGQKVAQGKVTQGEFAAIMVQQTILPNPLTYSPDELSRWHAAGLEIRPFALILEIIEKLGRHYGGAPVAYITPWELIRIAIPLAGTKTPPTAIAHSIVKNRSGNLDVSSWPNCAPASNDHRLAKEFLLFLANFGLCRHVKVGTSMEDKYYLDELFDIDAVAMPTTASIFDEHANANAIVDAVRHSPLPSIIERQRTASTILARTGQTKFRNVVLKAYSSQCFLTGETIGEILEAAHIIPVTHGGADNKDNGLCLRVDIHRLFDSGNIRIKPTGDLIFSDVVRASKNYSSLPAKINIPPFVNPANIHWRDSYY